MKNVILGSVFMVLLFCLGVFSSCNSSPTTPSENPQDGLEEYDVPYLNDRLELDNGAYCNMETPIFYEDKLIIMIKNVETLEGWINCYDKTSLELLWTWREALDEFGSPARGFGDESYIYENILCIAQNNISYGIDVNTGSTLWENRDVNSSMSYLNGNKSTIFNVETVEFSKHSFVKKASVETGIWEKIFEFSSSIDSLNIGMGTTLSFSWENNDYVCFTTTYWHNYPYEEITWLNLYNVTKDELEWTSDTIPKKMTFSPTPGRQPEFEDGQILLANDALYSYNVEDGSLEWWKEYEHTFTFSTNLTTQDGLVYGNNENEFFVGVNVHTGEERFRTTTGASASKIIYHDNRCYISSLTVGGTNHMMVIDAETGAILQDERAPFRDENVEYIFERAIAVDPETGYVYTGDHRYLLVYDFGD